MFKQRNDRVKVLGFTFSLGLCVFMQVMSEMHGQVDPTNIMFVGLIWSLFLIGHLYYWSPISTWTPNPCYDEFGLRAKMK